MGNVSLRKVKRIRHAERSRGAGKILVGALLSFQFSSAQPFVDIINTSYQSLSTAYKDSLHAPNRTDQNFLNLTIPVRLDSQNTIIARFYGERLYTNFPSGALMPVGLAATLIKDYTLYSALLPIGLQHETADKKWKVLGLAMPKISSDFKDQFNASYDFQMGGYAMATYSRTKNLSLKFGLFYNREAFGNFFIPIGAVDWKVCKWFQMYGVLPNNYRFEFALLQKKLYAGLAFKSYTRSYRLNSGYGHDYVRNNEMQLKLFVDVYLAKKFVLFGEFGRTIGYSPLVYKFNTPKERSLSAPQYFPINDAFFFNVGVAYRIRFDF
jgi:hypothetical protein